MKIKVGLFFGGQSVEHEVSVISGLQAYYAFDREKYDVIPVYISKDNQFYVGEAVGKIASYRDIKSLLSSSTRVILVREQDGTYLKEEEKKAFKKPYSERLDVAFPVVHGTNVEDGTIAGFFRTLCLPYAGCDVTSAALGMDKYAMKQVLAYEGIPVLPGVLKTAPEYRRRPETVIDDLEKKIGYPMIVKPVNLGSSVGIKVARDREKLTEALDHAFGFALRVLVERAITNLKEVNCAVLGDYEEARASECESPVSSGKDILDYQDKYGRGGQKTGAKSAPLRGSLAGSDAAGGSKTGSSGMASLTRELPAQITPDQKQKIREISIATFKALNCSGVARIDCMIDRDTNAIYVNEINTIPGSLSFYLWEPVGLAYRDLLTQLVELALKRERELSEISYSFDSNLLANFTLGGSKS